MVPTVSISVRTCAEHWHRLPHAPLDTLPILSMEDRGMHTPDLDRQLELRLAH